MRWSAKHGSLINTTFIFCIYPYVSTSCLPSVYSMCKYFFTHYFLHFFSLLPFYSFYVCACDFLLSGLCFLSTRLNWIIACFLLQAPSSLLDALEQHLASLEGKKVKDSTAASRLAPRACIYWNQHWPFFKIFS